MKLNTFAPKKSRAQAMVEFAIVLPLLLLLLYGLLEAGRLLFMYSTIVTATRQAARYGSATGQGVDYTGIGGPDNSSYPRYRDCYGIRQAAQRVDFLNSFDDVDITIQYDSGPGTVIDDTCNGDADPNVTPNTDNSSRILVTIEGDFNPIVPRIVPFIARTVANGNPIRAISARTIIVAVTIEVTPIGGGPPPGPGTSQLALAMTASPSTYAFPNDPITFDFTLTNNGTVDLTGFTFTLTHGVIISCNATTLAPGASTTCTGNYVITDPDITNGSVVAQTTVTATDGTNTITSNTATVTLTFTVLPQLALSKTASTEYATTGGTVVYTFTLTNTGNVPLTSVVVTDPKLGGAIPGCQGALASLASATCTASYTITANDIQSTTFVNTATATALYNGTQTITSNQASATVYTGPLYLRATVSPGSVSQPTTITYTYELINNTGTPLYAPYSVSGHRGTENCSPNTGGLPVGAGFTCSGTYTVTQSDIDTRASLDNSVTATACTDNTNCNGPRKVTSNTDGVSVTLVRTPALTLGPLNASYPPINVGTVITYTYPVTNSGNVTLSPSITDTKVGSVTCPALAPGATQNCTGTYTVTQADFDAGSITNQATATATFNSQTISSLSQSFTIFTYIGPRATLRVTPNPTMFTGVGQFIVYTYTVSNTGSVPLIGPFTVADSTVPFIDCSTATSPLATGTSTTCVGSYATTQADMNKGNIISSANVTGSDGTQAITSNSVMTVVYAPGAPTLTPVLTPVTGCGSITTSAITTPTDTMTMTITNPNPYAVTVSNVVVSWNRTGGSGSSILSLQRATLGGTQFWNGPSNNTGGPLTLTPSATLTIPGNNASTTITFTFDRNYQTESGESIIINLSTPGCESTPIHRP